MSGAGIANSSLRLEQAESSRLAWAFALSLCIHLLVFGGYYTGNKFHLWDNLHWPAWLHPLQALVEVFKKKPDPRLLQALQPHEPPLMFVEVNPEQASAEAPKAAKFYSDKNSIAANPDSQRDTGVPQISGVQKVIPKTQDAPPSKEYKPLQPTPPPKERLKEQPKETQKTLEKTEQPKPKPSPPPGDLAMVKPEDLAKKQAPAETPKPRRPTVQELRAQQQANRLPGQAMRQDGGVVSHSLQPSLDAKAVPWGAYDWGVIAAIQQRWDALLGERNYAADGQGKVVLHFTLHYDGRVSDMTVAETSVNDVLSLMCQRAVLDPAPYQAWPLEMRRMMGDTRNIQITFYYTY